MTPEYILRKSLVREPFCGDYKKDALANYKRGLSEIEGMRWFSHYSEPGYTEIPKNGILAANWNYFPRDIGDLLEKYGYAIEWCDEWTECDNCNGAVRTVANSYGWKSSYWFDEENCETVCEKCVLEYKPWTKTYIQDFINKPDRAITFDIDPTNYGFKLINDNLENGFYEGQNDDPKNIYKQLKDSGYSEILFKIDSVGQFDIDFAVYAKTTESEE